MNAPKPKVTEVAFLRRFKDKLPPNGLKYLERLEKAEREQEMKSEPSEAMNILPESSATSSINEKPLCHTATLRRRVSLSLLKGDMMAALWPNPADRIRARDELLHIAKNPEQPIETGPNYEMFKKCFQRAKAETDKLDQD